MSKVTHELTIKGLPYAISKERQEDPEFKRNILLALFPECAESQSIVIAEKKFGQKFYPMPYNWKGWDIISEDKSIKIEVKQTSVMGTSSDLSINSTWPKKDLCTHIMIFDFFNPSISISIIPHDEFFASKFHGNAKLWRWNSDYKEKTYSTRYGWNEKENVLLFLKYKFEE